MSEIITDNQDGTYTIDGIKVLREQMSTDQMKMVIDNASFDKAWNEAKGGVDEIIFKK